MQSPSKMRLILVVLMALCLAGCASPDSAGVGESAIRELHGEFTGINEAGLAEVQADGKVYAFVIPDELVWVIENTVAAGDHALVSFTENEQGQLVIQTIDCDECTMCN